MSWILRCGTLDSEIQPTGTKAAFLYAPVIESRNESWMLMWCSASIHRGEGNPIEAQGRSIFKVNPNSCPLNSQAFYSTVS